MRAPTPLPWPTEPRAEAANVKVRRHQQRWREAGLKPLQCSGDRDHGRFLCSGVEYYPNCEVMFMGMANIHAIRNSFQGLRTVCSQIPDPGK